MTLLEAFAALVILGASAVGFLGVFQNAARLVQSAAEWNRATTHAASVVDEAVRNATSLDPRFRGNDNASQPTTNARVETRPWSTNVNDVVVQVALPDGRLLTVHRLVRQK